MVVLAQVSRYRCATPASGGYSKIDVAMKRVWIVLSLLLVLGGCGSESGFTENDLRIPTGFLRVVHAVPDSPNLRVELQTQSFGILNFGQSTSFERVLPDINRTLKISLFNGTEFTTVSEETLNIALDEAVTVVIAGTLAVPQLFIFEEPAIIDGNIPIRFFNATSSPEAYDIYLTQDDETAISPIAQLSQFEDSKVEREPGENYRLRFANADSSDIHWDSGIFRILEGSTPVFLLIDNFGSGPNTVRLQSAGFAAFPEDQTPAAVQLTHMIPDAEGLIDIYLDGELLAGDLDYRDITEYHNIAPGNKLVTVTEAGLPENIIRESTIFIAAGEFQSITAINQLAIASIISNREDLRRVPSSMTVTISNFATPLSFANVFLISPGEDYRDFNPFIQFSTNTQHTQTVAVPQADYDLVFADQANNEIIRTTLPAAESALYRIYMTDTPGGGLPIELLFRGDLQNQ